MAPFGPNEAPPMEGSEVEEGKQDPYGSEVWNGGLRWATGLWLGKKSWAGLLIWWSRAI